MEENIYLREEKGFYGDNYSLCDNENEDTIGWLFIGMAISVNVELKFCNTS